MVEDPQFKGLWVLTSTALKQYNFCKGEHFRVKTSPGMQPEGVSSTMMKVKKEKDIHLQMQKVLDIWCEKRFAILLGQIQSKLIYRLVNYGLASM